MLHVIPWLFHVYYMKIQRCSIELIWVTLYRTFAMQFGNNNFGRTL